MESEKDEKNCSKIYELYVYGGKLCKLYFQNSANSAEDESLILTAWKGAEAYYFLKKWYLLLSAEKFYNAMCVAYKLQEYTQYLQKEVIYFAMAISAFRCQNNGVCSQAFTKLQSLKHVRIRNLAAVVVTNILLFQLNKMLQTAIDSVAIAIFLAYKPVNDNKKQRTCDNCKALISDWLTVCSECDSKFNNSLVTGLVLSGNTIWRCTTCNNFAEEDEIRSYNVCPLCHTKK